MGLCRKWTGLVSQTFSVPLICCGRQDKKWQPCVDWSFSLALGRAYDPHFPFALHGNLARIGSDWKLSGAQKPVQSAEGNVCMKASNLCSRQLPQAETIRAKAKAHQASGFSAFSTSNYLGDHTFRKPSDIWLPINPLCLSFSIFYLLRTVRFHRIIYFAVASWCWGRWIKVLHKLCFNNELRRWCYITSYLYEVKWLAAGFVYWFWCFFPVQTLPNPQQHISKEIKRFNYNTHVWVRTLSQSCRVFKDPVVHLRYFQYGPLITLNLQILYFQIQFCMKQHRFIHHKVSRSQLVGNFGSKKTKMWNIWR